MAATSVRQKLTQQIEAALGQLFDDGFLTGERPARVDLSPPKQQAHGDFACTVGLALAKTARKPPREIAAKLQETLGDAGGMLAKTEIAGPGFLNLFVSEDTWRDALGEILTAGADYLRGDHGKGQRVLVEFVSANPTGPLHVGHGRGAVVGDIVARLLAAAGYEVEREYYVNDFGNQVDVMARSVHLRYGELHGRPFNPPEEFYPGEYIVDIAQELKSQHGERFLDVDESEWLEPLGAFGVKTMVARIRADLEAFGIRFDRFVSEKEMVARGALDIPLKKLAADNHTYEEEGKIWFRSTDFGDTKDRVLVRDDGRSTYCTSDIAYHDDKLARGFNTLVNVWGADHGGYIARVKAGIKALGWDGDPLEVISIQMVSLSRGGEALKMGKRLGTAVWLNEVVSEAGRDATRYFFAMRRPEAQLDFDLELATKKSLDNPVYYAQMGHVRTCSIARKAAAEGVPEPVYSRAALDALVLPEEIGLIRAMARAPELVVSAALEREPHQVVHYIQDLITQFHSYFTQYKHTERVVSDDPDKTRARLLLCQGLRGVLRAFLEEILGVDAPEEMYLEEQDHA